MIAFVSFAVRRAAITVSLLLALSVCTFVIFFKIPADPAFFLLPNPQRASTAERIAARHALGVDRPMLEQYVSYLGRLLHGDFGLSWGSSFLGPDGTLHGIPVRTLLTQEAAVTGSLVLGGAVVLMLLSLPLGMLAAARANSPIDRGISAVSLIGISLHPIVLGVLLELTVSQKLGLLPGGGYCPLRRPLTGGCGGPLDWSAHLVLPWLTFALFFIALYTRMVRLRMLDSLRERYIQTARAKGASELRVLVRHALPNAIPPIVTMVGLDVGTAAGVVVYVERVYHLPGLGTALLGALAGTSGFDLPMISGLVILTASAIVTINLIVDIVAAAIDPRIREGRVRPRRSFARL